MPRPHPRGSLSTHSTHQGHPAATAQKWHTNSPPFMGHCHLRTAHYCFSCLKKPKAVSWTYFILCCCPISLLPFIAKLNKAVLSCLQFSAILPSLFWGSCSCLPVAKSKSAHRMGCPHLPRDPTLSRPSPASPAAPPQSPWPPPAHQSDLQLWWLPGLGLESLFSIHTSSSDSASPLALNSDTLGAHLPCDLSDLIPHCPLADCAPAMNPAHPPEGFCTCSSFHLMFLDP